MTKLTTGSTYATPNLVVNEVGKPWSEIEALTIEIAKKLGLTIAKSDGGTIFLKTN